MTYERKPGTYCADCDGTGLMLNEYGICADCMGDKSDAAVNRITGEGFQSPPTIERHEMTVYRSSPTLRAMLIGSLITSAVVGGGVAWAIVNYGGVR